MTTSSVPPSPWPEANEGTRIAASTSPGTPARRAMLLRLDPHELDRAPERLREADHGGVRMVGQEHTAGAQDDTRAARLGQRLLRLRLGVRARAVLERSPLVEAALDRPRHQGLALRERGSRAAVVGLAEASVVLFPVEGVAGRLDGVEDALGAFAEAGLHEGEDGLGDSDQRVLDEARVLLEVVVQAVARELAGQGQGAEDRGDDGAVGAPVHDAAD